MSLPSNLGDAAEYRLALEEYEVFETDSEVAESGLPIADAKPSAASDGSLRSRLVYFDAISL